MTATVVDTGWRYALLDRLSVGAWMSWDGIRSKMIDAVREQWQAENCDWAGDLDEDDPSCGFYVCDEEDLAQAKADWFAWTGIALKEALYLGEVDAIRSGKTDALRRTLDLRITPKGIAALAAQRKPA